MQVKFEDNLLRLDFLNFFALKQLAFPRRHRLLPLLLKLSLTLFFGFLFGLFSCFSGEHLSLPVGNNSSRYVFIWYLWLDIYSLSHDSLKIRPDLFYTFSKKLSDENCFSNSLAWVCSCCTSSLARSTLSFLIPTTEISLKVLSSAIRSCWTGIASAETKKKKKLNATKITDSIYYQWESVR